MCRTQMEDVGEAYIFDHRRIFSENNEYRRGNAVLLNSMHPGSANMYVEPRWKTLAWRIFLLIGEYYLQTANIVVVMSLAQLNAPRECQHVCRTQMEDVGEANIFVNRRISPANNEYRRGKAELLSLIHI